MLTRFDPWRELDLLTRDIFNGTRPDLGLPMDAYRRGDEFVVHFDLPGVDPDSIDLTVQDNYLTVRAERRNEPGDDVEVLVSERPSGTYVRRVFLGEALDIDKLEAHYDNGVLRVVVPVAESAKPRKVEITAGHKARELESESSAA